MNFENNYNATKAAEIVGVCRTTFYKLIKLYKIKPIGRFANMNLYAKKDLMRIKVK